MKKQLTLKEKCLLLNGKNSWHTNDLGGKLYKIVLSDGPVGVRKTFWLDWGNWDAPEKQRDIPATAYPSIEVLGQTWNEDLAEKMGECLADDCIEKGVDVLLAPGVNIKRSPVCGRNFEYPSEDPLLSGVIARGYILGLQSGHVGATLKHYLANNNEEGRLWASSNMDKRTMREIYMRNFEIALEAKPWAVMCSYNLLNGVRVSENKECFDILRNELGFGEGLLMSDWCAVKDRTAAAKAGLDLAMPLEDRHIEKLEKDYNDGKITEEELNACLERVLAFIDKAEKESKMRKIKRTKEERHFVAREIEEEGVVLLKNENAVLPVKKGASVAITGKNLNKYFSGGGSARVTLESAPKTLTECLKEKLAGSDISVAEPIWHTDYPKCFLNAEGKDVSIVVCGSDAGEGDDRKDLTLCSTYSEEKFIKAVAKHNKNTVVVIFGGGVTDVEEFIDDVAAVIYVGFAGESGGEAIANILCGNVCPSGKLAETFAKRQKDYPSENIAFNGLDYDYKEGLAVGYRYFDSCPEKIRFPFGHGLSYTTFEYSNIAVNKVIDVFIVSFDVKNIGKYDGKEISQVYCSQKDFKGYKPLKELRGFAKTYIKKGETKRVEIKLDDRSFYHFDEDKNRWTFDAGEYEISVGASSRDIRLFENINI